MSSRPHKEDLVRVVAEIRRENGSVVEAQLLRASADRSFYQPGSQIPLFTQEEELSGWATVLSVDDQFELGVGRGNLVTGLFCTTEVDLIATVGLSNGESISGTPSHWIWRITDSQFVELQDLEPGDVVDTIDGVVQVVSVSIADRPQPVYNLEVSGEHVYRIGLSGVLVHNNGAGYDDLAKGAAEAAENASKGSAYNAENFGEVLGNWSRSRANPMNSAEAAADMARLSGHRGGAASELVLPNGRVYTGVSSAPYRSHELVDGVLAGCRNPGNYHGSCAEVRAIAKALHAGESVEVLRGAVSKAVYIGGRYPNQTHGAFRAPCQSCEDMLSYLGIFW